MSEVIFVGTSDAFGAGGRRQSAILLRAKRGAALLDCGPTTLTGLVALQVSRDEIDSIVITHYHGDHFGGVPLFLLAAKYGDLRRRPIHIVGPGDVREKIEAASRALGHPMDEGEWPFEIRYESFDGGGEVAAGPVGIRAFETNHQADALPHGVIVDTAGFRIAYSGDTGWFEKLPELVRGTELFISECTLYDGDFPYHLNYRQLEMHKSKFDCGRIILTHLGPEMTDRRGTCGFETADDGLILKL